MKECIPKLKIIEKEINKAETEIEKYEIKNEFYNTYFWTNKKIRGWSEDFI